MLEITLCISPSALETWIQVSKEYKEPYTLWSVRGVYESRESARRSAAPRLLTEEETERFQQILDSTVVPIKPPGRIGLDGTRWTLTIHYGFERSTFEFWPDAGAQWTPLAPLVNTLMGFAGITEEQIAPGYQET